MNKSEIYTAIVEIQKQTGQGTSGIVAEVAPNRIEFVRYLDELIDEGLVKACHTGNTIGSRGSNIFYVPTKGYCVWDDKNTPMALEFVRFYLGLLHYETKNKWEMTEKMFVTDPTILEKYLTWLNMNKLALEIMLALDPFYDLKLVDREIAWVQQRDWYINNNTVAESLVRSTERHDSDTELLGVMSELLVLYDKKGDSDKVRETNLEIVEVKKNINIRTKVNSFLETLDKTSKIKETFSAKVDIIE